MRLIVFLLAFATAGVLGTEVMADGYSLYGPQRRHAAHHDDLEHREFHRGLKHRNAHRYPMTPRQHGHLHDRLEHDSYHDYLEHRGAHRSGAYYGYPNYRYGYGYYPRSGFYYGRPGISFRFGF